MHLAKDYPHCCLKHDVVLAALLSADGVKQFGAWLHSALYFASWVLFAHAALAQLVLVDALKAARTGLALGNLYLVEPKGAIQVHFTGLHNFFRVLLFTNQTFADCLFSAVVAHPLQRLSKTNVLRFILFGWRKILVAAVLVHLNMAFQAFIEKVAKMKWLQQLVCATFCQSLLDKLWLLALLQHRLGVKPNYGAYFTRLLH